MDDLEREIKQRKRFYPSQVKIATIKKDVAEHRIFCFEKVLESYKKQSLVLLPLSFQKAIVKEVERELTMRRRFYPQYISRGQITAAKAAHQINCLVQVLQDYEDRNFTGIEVVRKVEVQAKLF